MLLLPLIACMEKEVNIMANMERQRQTRAQHLGRTLHFANSALA